MASSVTLLMASRTRSSAESLAPPARARRDGMAGACAARGCSEDVCVLASGEGKALEFCLVHYYGSAYAAAAAAAAQQQRQQQQQQQDRQRPELRVVSARALKRQRRSAEDLVREMVAEIAQDLDAEVERVRGQRERSEKLKSGALHKQLVQQAQQEATAAARTPAKSMGFGSRQGRQSSGAAKVGTVDVDKLYEWQMKMLHQKQSGNKRKEDADDPASSSSSRARSRKPASAASTSTASTSAPRQRVWKPTGEELLGQANIPVEPWRRNAAELVANALLQDVDTARFDAGKVALNVEMALFMYLKDDQPAYKQKMRSLLFNLRTAANESLRRKLATGALPPADFVRMDEEALMDPEKRAELERAQAEVFEQHRVVAPEDALASKTFLPDATCPRCEKEGILKFSLAASRPESTKAEIYGNKERVDASTDRYRCPGCGYTWEDR